MGESKYDECGKLRKKQGCIFLMRRIIIKVQTTFATKLGKEADM